MEVIKLANRVNLQVVAQNPRIMREDQSVIYVNVMEIWGRNHGTTSEEPNHKIRVTIRANAYKFQSHGKVERWDGTRWHEVVSVPGPSLKLEDTSLYVTRYSDDKYIALFNPDVWELLRYAKEVL